MFNELYYISVTQKLVLVSLFSLLIGSFLSVCIFRIPLGRPKGLESLEYDDSHEPFFEIGKVTISSPKRSFCPECNATLKWYNNIPVFSYLFQGGQCTFCKVRIPFRYPLVEILSLVCALTCFSLFDFQSGLINYIVCCALIVITFIDIDYYIIPNIISVPGAVFGLIIGIINHYFHVFESPLVLDIPQSIIGIAFGGGFLWTVATLYKKFSGKEALGFGDVKLLAMVGAFYGFEGALMTILLGSILGTIIGGLQIIINKGNTSTPIPFGPYLAMGTIIFIFGEYLPFINNLIGSFKL